MVISANEIKREYRLHNSFYCDHYECTRRRGDEVNDKTANDDDESSLSLDRRFVHIGACTVRTGRRKRF